MWETLIQLVILFFVIFDPPASFSVFLTASSKESDKERKVMAFYSIAVAAGLSFLVLILGSHLLTLFSTNIDEFKVAGGIILGLLGIRMALGDGSSSAGTTSTGRAVAAVIGTPLLTGPAAITAIIVSVQEHGRLMTGLAVGIVLFLTGILLVQSKSASKIIGNTSIQILTTILGLITVAWGVKFITEGLIVILA